MTNEGTPGAHNTDITPEMQMLFAALDVDSVKCYECGRRQPTEKMVWDNSCMWFVCPTCRSIEH